MRSTKTMREIKFRAWDKENKKWRHGSDFLFTDSGSVLLYDIEEGRKLPNLTGKWREDEDGNIELVQFTGLKDKNGKPIYEGDIVRRHWSGGKPEDQPVVFTEAAFMWGEGKRATGLNGNWAEVIGNIYENPELLQ
jgi:uncharacterized phage protein (TIGR01671 family)